jgi:hypothetical protein
MKSKLTDPQTTRKREKFTVCGVKDFHTPEVLGSRRRQNLRIFARFSAAEKLYCAA